MPLVVAAPAAQVAALRERGLAPYVDEFMRAGVADRDHRRTRRAAPSGPFVLRILPASQAEAARIAAAAVALQAWLPEGLVRVPDRVVSCGEDRRVPVYLNPRTLDLAGVSASCPPPAQVTSDVPGAASIGSTSERRRCSWCAPEKADRFASGVDVAASRTLTVEEIIARHQAAAARQASRIATAISRRTFTLTFEAPGFVAPITITSETTIYHDAGPGGRPTSARRDIRVNGVSFTAGGGVPRLPIIEPERAAAPPLAITLSDVYRYRLAGREPIGGRAAYVVPSSRATAVAPLYRRAGVDRRRDVRHRARRRGADGLKGPITASEQADDFARDAAGRWLLTRSDVRQTYEGASVRTPIHRLLVVDAARRERRGLRGARAEALASATSCCAIRPEGFRYLVKREAGADGSRRRRKRKAGSTAKAAAERRVVAGRADRIRTFAFGVIVDPNISRPLPFAGLSYVDFNLFGTGTQFSGFFGGSYGQLAFTVPSIGGTRWQIAGRAFGIASFYNDRAFVQGASSTRSTSASARRRRRSGLLRPLSARTALRIEYDWDYNRFARDDVTAPDFVIPRHQNAHAIRLGLDAQRAGWQGSVWAATRSGSAGARGACRRGAPLQRDASDVPALRRVLLRARRRCRRA